MGLNLYLLELPEKDQDYDQTNACIIAAMVADEARKIASEEATITDRKKSLWLEEADCRLIGIAIDGIETGILLEDQGGT